MGWHLRKALRCVQGTYEDISNLLPFYMLLQSMLFKTTFIEWQRNIRFQEFKIHLLREIWQYTTHFSSKALTMKRKKELSYTYLGEKNKLNLCILWRLGKRRKDFCSIQFPLWGASNLLIGNNCDFWIGKWTLFTHCAIRTMVCADC